MHVKKLRLLTPGPTPLYPPAVRAMAGADIHHRTEDFRRLYKRVLENLAHFMGANNDVVLFTASGTGAMESAVSNLFSPGDKVLVASAGKVRRTLGRADKGIRAGCNRPRRSLRRGGRPRRGRRGLGVRPGDPRRLHAGNGKLDRRFPRYSSDGRDRTKDRGDLRGRCRHRSGDQSPRHRRLGASTWSSGDRKRP